MKKLLICILILATLCSIFVACNGDDNTDESASTSDATTIAADTTTEGSTAATTTKATTAKTTSPWDDGKFSANTQYANDSDWTPEF